MKFPASLSTLLHVAILTWGLLSLSGPKPLAVADVEALPIDIVPIEDVTRAVQGEKKADVADKPAPKPTQKPQKNPDAQNVGEAEVDAKTQRVAEPTPKPDNTQRADAAPKAEKPDPAPKVKPEPVAQPVKESVPEKTTELAALDQPRQPVPDETPIETPAPAETGEEFAKLPDNVPVPQPKPEPPKPASAETRDRKEQKEKPKEEKTSTSSQDAKSPTDEIAALLNKEKPSDAGAKRSTERAALGTKKEGTGGKLSQSEMDALRDQLANCWSIPVGAQDGQDLRASIKFFLDQNGKLTGQPEVSASSGNRQFDESAKRAILKCDRDGLNVPAGKYDIWNTVVVNFDPSQMF
ncbi:MAG: TonB family protein [Nitratireductor sp.]